MTDKLSLAVHVFASRVSMSVFVDETLLPRLVNLSTHFKELPFSVEHINEYTNGFYFFFFCIYKHKNTTHKRSYTVF